MMVTRNFTFDKKVIEDIVRKEYKFVTNLLSILPIPESAHKDDDSSEEEIEENNQSKETSVKTNGVKKTTRAKSLTELQARLEAIKKTKKKMSYKDKLLKKGIKNRLKKQSKHDVKNVKQKLIRAAELEQNKVKEEEGGESSTVTSTDNNKPVFNSDNKLVFSKIDFSNIGKSKVKKGEKDPKKILKNLEKQKEKIEKLETDGNKEKASEIKEKDAWKNALAKAQGEKVKDDPLLLKKSLRKTEEKKKSSKKKWEKRVANVEAQKDERQKKRTENIQKRKKDKKLNKMKKAVKKGKIIPGF